MSFLEQQYLDFENVLSYRTRVDINRLDAILNFAEKNIDALGLRVTGNTLFTVFETVKDKNKCILGIEILIPVDKAFESSEQYVYKPEFRLVNAPFAAFECLVYGSKHLKSQNTLVCKFIHLLYGEGNIARNFQTERVRVTLNKFQ